MKIDGACHCERIMFDADVDESTVVVCHCTDCQILSGSPFRVTVAAPIESFNIRGEEPCIYVKVSESGAKRLQAFCPTCGTPLYSSTKSNPSHVFIRLGAIRQRASLCPTIQIWQRSVVSWLQHLVQVPASSEQQALKQT